MCCVQGMAAMSEPCQKCRAAGHHYRVIHRTRTASSRGAPNARHDDAPEMKGLPRLLPLTSPHSASASAFTCVFVVVASAGPRPIARSNGSSVEVPTRGCPGARIPKCAFCHDGRRVRRGFVGLGGWRNMCRGCAVHFNLSHSLRFRLRRQWGRWGRDMR